MAARAISLTSSSSGCTGLHTACEERDISLVKEYAEMLIHNGNRAESLHFLLGKNASGMSAIDIVARDTSKEASTILSVLRRTVAQLQGTLTAGSSPERARTPVQGPTVPRLSKGSKQIHLIFEALLDENLTALSEQVAMGGDLNALFKGETLLTFATLEGNYEAVKILLGSSTIEVNKVNEEGKTPYDIAMDFRFEDIAKLLLQYGGRGSEELRQSRSLSSAERLMRSQRVESFQALINCSSEDNSMPPIYDAVANGNHHVLGQLLEGGLDPNEPFRGQTPLMRAVVQRDFQSLQMLLSAPQIRPGLQSPEGMTPLEIALLLPGCDAFVDLLLLANETYVTSRDVIVSVPLQYSSSTGSSSSAPDMPPLFGAIHSKNNSLLMSRLMAGLNPNEMFDGDTPLTFAIRQLNLEAVRSLCATHMVDANRPNETGQTPLTLAVHMESLEIAALLVRKGADPDLPNRDGQTPNALAASKELHLIQGIFATAECLREFTEAEFLEAILANQI
ncbi:MAG: ankyrin repeat domain-containing protein [Chlamydiota bacterium]